MFVRVRAREVCITCCGHYIDHDLTFRVTQILIIKIINLRILQKLKLTVKIVRLNGNILLSQLDGPALNSRSQLRLKLDNFLRVL